ncbi:hypothetical protein [Brevibacillus sp. LEMMJ03]|uniref:hypothetical protein n=1 Tax=Brevibacillus sp. LEMMJ03 TaxID=2595056 RepID=UPI00163D91EE|nr:hypothetical protein [Brevibacillus sp. LEMMJ03]
MLPAAWPTPGREQAQKKATRLRLSPLRFSACAEPKRERRPRVALLSKRMDAAYRLL